MTYLLFFLAGLFLANGVPHFVKGVTGEFHMTPFQKPSGPVINVLWGTLNFIVGSLSLHAALDNEYQFYVALLLAFGGALLTGIILSLLWRKDGTAKGSKEK